MITYVDTHGFAGGFAAGATMAGMKLVGKKENAGGFGIPLMEANRVFLGDDWESEACDPADWTPVSADVQVATPPCSAFSAMTAGMATHGMHSDINNCMRDVFSYAAKIRPQVVAMESVSQAYTRGLPLMRELVANLNEATGLSYSATHVIQNNWSTGGCTKRKRYFLIASQVPFGVESFDLKRLPTVGDAFGDLVAQPLSWDPQPYASPANWWTDHLRNPADVVDGHMSPSNIHTRRIDDLTKGTKGVAWHEGESDLDVMRRYYQTNGDLPESLMYISPTKTTTRGDQLIALDFKTGGFSKPKRWPWDQPGRVINGAGPHMVWHPNGRFITHRETARLLGFPDSWVTGSASTHKNLNMFWGKGTSVHPAHWVMEWVKNSMEGNPGSNVGEELDAGDRLIDVSMDYKPLWQAELARRGASEELVEVA